MNQSKIRRIAVIAVTAAFFCFQMYLAFVKQLTPMLQSPVHLVFALFLIYMYYPADCQYRKRVQAAADKAGSAPDPEHLDAPSWMNYFDLIPIAMIAFLGWYSVTQYARLRDFVPFVDDVYPLDCAAMVIAILLLLEAVRRSLGAVLFFFIIAFIAFAWVSPHLPGILYTKGLPFGQMLDQFAIGMTMTEAGVFGTPLYTSASALFYFIVFGVFFSTCGGGQLLIDTGMKFSTKSSGGPAKAAVMSSALMGMVSGSAVANVSTTGVMTIPMMKKIGYAPQEAGAIEAVASTGGQIMPPIMGVGAFIMAEMLGVSYFSVACAAIIPAIAYYFGVFVLVTFLARKRGEKRRRGRGDQGLPADPAAPVPVDPDHHAGGLDCLRRLAHALGHGRHRLDPRVQRHKLLRRRQEELRWAQAALGLLPARGQAVGRDSDPDCGLRHHHQRGDRPDLACH